MRFLLLLLFSFWPQYLLAAEARPLVVLELFTSQSCSSCPAADALLKELVVGNPSFIALSYHVDYWDHLDWKDPYSSRANTLRQQAYAAAFGSRQVYTPQLIINGSAGMVGSSRGDVMEAIAAAQPAALNVSLATGSDGRLALSVTPLHTAVKEADIVEVRFNRYARTQIPSGENEGKRLENIHNVTAFKTIGRWQRGSSQPWLIDPLNEDGIAVLLQAPGQGVILGAAQFMK